MNGGTKISESQRERNQKQDQVKKEKLMTQLVLQKQHDNLELMRLAEESEDEPAVLADVNMPRLEM